MQVLLKMLLKKIALYIPLHFIIIEEITRAQTGETSQ